MYKGGGSSKECNEMIIGVICRQVMKLVALSKGMVVDDRYLTQITSDALCLDI